MSSETHSQVFLAFLKGEEALCPWNTPEGGLRSSGQALELFGYGWEAPSPIAYWEDGKLFIPRGVFHGATYSEAPSVKKALMKVAKENGVSVFWGKYRFQIEGKKPVEMEIHDSHGEPFGIRISRANHYFRDNPGLFDNSGFSGLVCQNGPDIKFVWADDKFAQDERGVIYDLAAIFAMADKVSAYWHYGVKKFEYKK